MNEKAKLVTDDALRLSPEERVDLLDALWISLQDHDAEVERAWAVEIEKRIAALDRGEVEVFDAEDVLAELHERLRKK